MTDDIFIKVDPKSLEDVMRALRSLDHKMGINTLMKALNKGVRPLEQAARQNAMRAKQPHRVSRGIFQGIIMQPGTLKKSIGHKSIKRDPPVVYMGPERGSGKKYDAYYAHWVERGRFKSYQDRILPRPFMRPAWDAQHENAIKIIRNYLRDELKKLGKWEA